MWQKLALEGGHNALVSTSYPLQCPYMPCVIINARGLKVWEFQIRNSKTLCSGKYITSNIVFQAGREGVI